MIPVKDNIKRQIKDTQGFTLIELMVVIALVSVLATIAGLNYLPFKMRTYDTVALTDARNLLDSVVIAALGDEDVNYEEAAPFTTFSGPIGDLDNSNSAIPPVFTLSSGVEARVSGKSNLLNGETTIFAAFIYHIKGTDDLTPSGKKEYFCFLNESNGLTMLP